MSSPSTQPTSEPFLIDVPRPSPGKTTSIEPLCWEGIFGRDRPLRVEIGFGRSEFLIELAMHDGDYNYLGFEYSRKRVDKFLAKAHRAGVENVRAICQNVTYVLDRLIEPQSVDQFYVLFPDPWPKRRHAKHRFVQERNVRTVIALLRDGGGISLRTDDCDYAAQMAAVLDAQPELVNLAGTGRFAATPRDPIPTLYQLRWQREGREIFFLEYEKSAP